MQQFGAQWGETALQQWSAACSQWATWQSDAAQRCHDATDQAAQLIKTSVTQAGKLAEQWQAASVDASRRALEFVAPRS